MTAHGDEWSPTTIGELGKVVTGKTPPTASPEMFGDKYPFITPSDIAEGERAVHTERFLSEKGKDRFRGFLLPPGAVCFTCIGATIGKLCVTAGPSFTNQQINSVVVDKTKHDWRFVYYLLRHESDRIKAIAGGAATPIINKTVFSGIELVMPPLPTQRKIAAIFSAYDDLIENNTRRIAVLEEMAQMLFREWFADLRFPGHGSVPMTDSPLGPIPQGWRVTRVRTIIKRLAAGLVYTGSDVSDVGKIPVIDQSRDEVLGFHDDDPAHIASPQDPLSIFGDHTCKTQLMFHSFSVGPNVVVFRSADATPLAYVYYLLRGLVETREYKRHWTELTNKEVLIAGGDLPAAFSTLVTPLIEGIDALRRINLTLRQTRDLLLPKLISGELDVEDLDIEVGELSA